MLARSFGSGCLPQTSDRQAPGSSSATALAVHRNAVTQAAGDLFKFAFSDKAGVLSKFYLEHVNVTVKIVCLTAVNEKEKAFQYVMCVFSASGICILEQNVHPRLQLEIYDATNSFVWTSAVPEGSEEGVHKWSIIFTDPSQRPAFLFELKRCMDKASTQMPCAHVEDDGCDFCPEAHNFGWKLTEAKPCEHGNHRRVMLNRNAPSELDLGTSKVEEEWRCPQNVDKLLKPQTFTPSTKFGGVLEKPTLISLAMNVGGNATKRPRLKRSRSSSPAFRDQVLQLLRLNVQPYRQGAWEKAPLSRRPYEPISAYQVAADIPADDKQLCLATLQTNLPEGWADFAALADKNLFTTNTLQRSSLGEHIGLRLGQDFEERDVWGIDCYTRRSVLDVLTLSPGMRSMERRVAFLERELLPAIQRQGRGGWDMVLALRDVAAAAASRGDAITQNGAEVLQRAILQLDVEDSGEKWSRRRLSASGSHSSTTPLLPRPAFRVHPKGVGIVCTNPRGLPKETFVADYLGELYPPWRWFERQDLLKKLYPSQELPDFYHMCLERPKEDSRGCDIVFVEAARRSSFASRLCHSCDPNCHTIVMSVGGQLTMAVYTSRYVHPGEELCWDHAPATEFEKEYRAAVCLCGSVRCRGSFLSYVNTNSATFVGVMARRHTFLDRNACIVRAGMEPLTEEDRIFLAERGIKSSALKGLGVDGSQDLPQWLIKWAALILQYIDREFAELPDVLVREKLSLEHDEAAIDSARGVRDHRLQNLLITLNKTGHCLRQRGQLQGCPLRRLSEQEVLRFLWLDADSVMARWVEATSCEWHCRSVKKDKVVTLSSSQAVLDDICTITHQTCNTVDEARAQLRALSRALRRHGGRHAAAADCLLLYAETETWVTPENYLAFSSAPVSLADDLPSQAPKPGSRPSTGRRPPNVKRYQPQYIWGQLAAWFKQTIHDPHASLSADRRGSMSLPDPESAYAEPPSQYIRTDRRLLLDHLQRCPDRQWPVSWQWTFRNPRKVYGSPFLDAALAAGRGQPSRLPALLEELRSYQ